MNTKETAYSFIKRTYKFGEDITVMGRTDPKAVVAQTYPESLQYSKVYSGNAAIALNMVLCKDGEYWFERADGNTVYVMYTDI